MNRYVDGAVAASGDGTSWASAWKRLADIDWSLIAPGDTIYVSGGTYRETLNVGASGSPSGSVTVTRGADPGHDGEVIIDAGSTLRNGIAVWNQDWVTVDGFTVRNPGDSGINVDGATAGVVIQNNSVDSGDPGGGNARGFDIRNSVGANAVIVRNNSFGTPASTSAQTDGIYSMDNDGVVFEGNTIVISNGDTTGHSDGFQSFRDGNVTATGNLFVQANPAATDNHGAWMSDTRTGGVIRFTDNLVLATNLTGSDAVTHWMEPDWTGTGTAAITGNAIVGGRAAVALPGSTGAVVTDNLVEPAGSDREVVTKALLAAPDGVGNLVLDPAGAGSFTVGITGTGLAGGADGEAYDGPVPYLHSQLICRGSLGLTVTARVPDAFLRGGTGCDVLQATSGRNVLDGGPGQNLLVGGTGADTFFLDARTSAPSWSAIANFHAGDQATIWGFDPARTVASWSDDEGFAGYRGATLHVQPGGGDAPDTAALTFVGMSVAAAQATLTVTTGSTGGGLYLLLQA